MTTRYHCCDERRLKVLELSGSANAIAYVDVLDRAAPAGVPRQRTLFVRLLRVPAISLEAKNIRISGGERIRAVGVEWVALANALPAGAEPGLATGVDDPSRTLVVRTDGSGDFSMYTLSLVVDPDHDDPPPTFDPRLSSIAFSFKVECASDFDCAPACACPPEKRDQPDIDYLAKDYTGFRRLMLDRMSLLVPDWRERSAADAGVMLVELLAYAADQLSYRQDAIANEAYLSTARRRVSVRRHARLVDYLLHEGCNARSFVQFDVAGQGVPLAKAQALLTRRAGLGDVVDPTGDGYRAALASGAPVFETAHAAVLDERLNAGQLRFHTWGDEGCCLPKGATRATLHGRIDALKAGDFLLFEELLDPGSMKAEDADPKHRCVVRLTSVTFTKDPSGMLFDAQAPSDAPLDITEIEWDQADALAFPLCLSVAANPDLVVSRPVGNVVLADHGRTLADAEDLGKVAAPWMEIAEAAACDGCEPREPRKVPLRYRPTLAQAPLAHGFDVQAMLDVERTDDTQWWPASALLAHDPRTAMPLIPSLAGERDQTLPPDAWTVRRDLLQSKPASRDFCVETDDDGRAHLRFGDDVLGKRPDDGTTFDIVYRVGNGIVGNVGAGAIAHIVDQGNAALKRVANPMPANGGVDPESTEAARRDAPQAFRTQERAITAADYAAATERRADVQRAAAKFRWTGSWYTVFVTPDRVGGAEVDVAFAKRVRRHLERFRAAGYDLAVRTPRHVPLDVALHVCVRAGYFRAGVLQAVRRVLSSDVLADGTLGAFHPDNFTFGEPVYLSRIVAAVQAVEGVEAVWPQRFQRMVDPVPASLDDGVIDIGAMEIAQLANDPSFRERGRLEVTAGGGK
jgi:hypothetical protein